MKVKGIDKVAVIGAGLMGFGIGVDFARAGYQVTLMNTSAASSRAAMSRARKGLSRMTAAGLLGQEEADATYARLKPTTDLEEAASGAGYIIESVLEQLPLKREVFRRLDDISPPACILASNTSTITASELARATEHPERVVIAHYFQPPHLIPLVELMGGEKTSRQTIERTFEILTRMRKKPVIVRKETPSLIGNVMQRGIAMEAFKLVEEGICTAQEVDTVIKMGFGRRLAVMGYFEKIDIAGLDLRADIARSSGKPVPDIIQEHLNRGELGAKTGKGFYEWTPESVERLENRFEMELIRLLKRDYEDGTI